jgi:glycosyltransferase involved in cell wall biosynthesis
VTCVDPDEAVSRGGMGVVVHEFDQLVAAVSTLMADPSLRREMGARARQYIATHHSGEDTYGRLAAVLDRLVAEKRRR